MSEFNLSDKIIGDVREIYQGHILKRDVKEFIRLLKEENINDDMPNEIIDELAGDKLK